MPLILTIISGTFMFQAPDLNMGVLFTVCVLWLVIVLIFGAGSYDDPISKSQRGE